MIIINKNSLSMFIMISLFGCIDPSSEDLWSISIDTILETNGFARDVAVDQNIAFVAAGQSGIQLWNLKDQYLINDFQEYWVPAGTIPDDFNDLSLIEVDTLNKLIFVNETNQNVMVFSYQQDDTLIFFNDILSSRTKDFISFPSDSGSFVMYAADNDDGMKWSVFTLNEYPGYTLAEPSFPDINAAEISTPGSPQGIDSDGNNFVVMAVDQLGVELFSIDSLGAFPSLVGRVDTEGNAEKVTLIADGVYVACDDAGAAFIPIESFSSDNKIYRFAEDLTVDHIAIKGNIASLTLGSKGIALYDVSDPRSPVEKGIFPVGYSYRSIFWEDNLLVCTREGLQVITIEQ